jgi:hypothetical protein
LPKEITATCVRSAVISSIYLNWAVEGRAEKVSGIPPRPLGHVGYISGDVGLDVCKTA